MEGPGDQFFANTAFSLDENGNVCIGNLIYRLHDFGHLVALKKKRKFFISTIPVLPWNRHPVFLHPASIQGQRGQPFWHGIFGFLEGPVFLPHYGSGQNDCDLVRNNLHGLFLQVSESRLFAVTQIKDSNGLVAVSNGKTHERPDLEWTSLDLNKSRIFLNIG